MNHSNVVHTFVLVPQATKIPDAKAAVDKEWEKLEKLPAWLLIKVRSKMELFWKYRKTRRKSTLLH